MINPAEIIDNLVELMRDIPDLVALVGDDDSRIYAYHDRYPDRTSLEKAKREMPAPSIMVAYQGTEPGSFGPSEVWRHGIVLTLRTGEEQLTDSTPDGYYQLFRQIVKGVPAGQTQALQLLNVHASCHPMDTPTLRRNTDVEGVDYFEVLMSFTEIGDD